MMRNYYNFLPTIKMKLVWIVRNLRFHWSLLWFFCAVNLVMYVFIFNRKFMDFLPNHIGLPTMISARVFNISKSFGGQFIDKISGKPQNITNIVPRSDHSGNINNSLYVLDNYNKTSTGDAEPYYYTHIFRRHSNKYYTSRILNRKLAEKSPAFSPAMSLRHRRILQDILLKLKDELDKYGISYFMYSGTLLGSYRHHDIIPWDDDIDIMVNFTQRKTLFNALNTLRPFFFLDVHMDVRWKFYSIQSRPIKTVPWSWPFLDISFYRENSTHIWDSDKQFKKYYSYKKAEIFPLTKRAFMGMVLPAPNDTAGVLKFYKPEICRSASYNHRKEIEIKRVYNTNCFLLNTRYPMVTRQTLSNGVNETLVLRGKVLKWFFYWKYIKT